jgi:hypothetical protein
LRASRWEGVEKFGVHSASYRYTRVCVSNDRLFFETDNEVGVINAHAAEAVVDEHGAMWVGHCGWGQGGVSRVVALGRLIVRSVRHRRCVHL